METVATLLTRLKATIPTDQLTEWRALAARKGWLAVEMLAEEFEAAGRRDEATHAWIACASEDGSPSALLALGRHRNDEIGRKMLEEAAKDGEVEAANLLAERLEGEQGIYWQHQAALRGDMDTAFEMVRRLVAVPSHDVDINARYWLETAARFGQPQARFTLGAILIEEGAIEAGYDWLHRAANDGVAEAKVMLEAMKEAQLATTKPIKGIIISDSVSAPTDLTWLDETKLQDLIRKTEIGPLALALRDASPEILDRFRGNVSTRAWKTLVRHMLAAPPSGDTLGSQTLAELVRGESL
ncbi:MAG: FliG C-terminal domain-containing protein [Magnetospirillum sp.]